MAPPTLDTKSFVGPFTVLQLIYIVSIGLLFTTAFVEAAVDRSLLYLWLVESIGNLVIRISLFALLRRYYTPYFSANPKWRFVSPMIGLIHGCHWAWTAVLFVGPEPTVVTLTTLFVFVLMSIASMAIVPASPAAAVLIVIFIWVPTTLQLWSALSGHNGTFVVVLLLSIVTIMWTSLYLSIVHVHRYLRKSDEVVQLVDQLWLSNAELERMRAQAATELQNRSQFFNGASHDFAQRLHGLKLLAHIAQDPSLALTSGPGKMLEALEDLETYVRDVLEFARTEGSTLTPSLRPARLQDIFQKLLLHFESIADARGVDLRIRTTGAVVETDPAMLLRILENIISNAIKYTRQRVLVAARRRKEGWVVEVWDQGPGIPLGDETAIFQAFYQHRVYVDRRREGVGLGLAIVRRIASLLQYSIVVRSREGRGTVMTIHGLRAATQADDRDRVRAESDSAVRR